MNGEARALKLEEVETLLASDALVLDACRRGIALGGKRLALVRRPILFALARCLAQAWPQDVSRDALIATAFREVARTLACACDAGTAFDGKHLWQIAEARIAKIDPATGKVLASIPAPAAGKATTASCAA